MNWRQRLVTTTAAGKTNTCNTTLATGIGNGDGYKQVAEHWQQKLARTFNNSNWQHKLATIVGNKHLQHNIGKRT
jgi:hypothetical protein